MQQAGASALSDAGDDLYYGGHLYVDRANLAVASAHIQEEFGIRKRKWAMYFRPSPGFIRYASPRRLVFRSRRFSRDLFYCDIGWSVATLFQGFATGLMSLIVCVR